MKKTYYIISLCLLLATACRQAGQHAGSSAGDGISTEENGGRKDVSGKDVSGKGVLGNNVSGKDVSGKGVSAASAPRYSPPEIPLMITAPQQRAAYYVQHYWDGYSLTDTAYLHSSDTEQLYADFLGALPHANADEQSAALRSMMMHMEADSTAYAHFCYLGEKYLYDPNSPMRNEDYYIPLLKQMLQSPRLTEAQKLRPADRLKQARKNRPGMVAADFTYVTPKGETHRLSQLQADYILLFFYDPDCSNCRESEHILSSIPFLLDLQKSNKLCILAIYPDDDRNEWLQNAPQMPQGWTVGWNRQGDIRCKQLYDLRATPTLYLLDRQKKVILKDASLERVVQYLSAGQ